MSSGGLRQDEASLSSLASPSRGSSGEMRELLALVVLGFFELVVRVIVEVDLVYRMTRSADWVLIFLGERGTRRRVDPVAFLVAATDLDVPNGVLVKLIVRVCPSDGQTRTMDSILFLRIGDL